MSIKLLIILKATEIERRGKGISVCPRFQLFQEDNFEWQGILQLPKYSRSSRPKT